MRSWISTVIYTGHGKFFRIRLLTLDSDQIEELVKHMDEECKGIRDEALRISWSMRGGISYDQALQLSFSEREIISKIIKENLETTKKSGLPYF